MMSNDTTTSNNDNWVMESYSMSPAADAPSGRRTDDVSGNISTAVLLAADDDDIMSYFTPANGMIYVPKVAAVLSLIGSYCIIREVWNDMHRGRATAISKVLLSMSLADILFSFGWLLTTWPAPESLTYLRDTNYGNQATCTAQGFILELGGATTAYLYAFLAACYLMIIKYNVRERNLGRIVKWGMFFCWLLALIGAIIPIPLGMYNFSWYVCWVQAHPLGCSETWQVGAEHATCERGDNAFLYSIIVQVVPRWTCFFICVILMLMIFWAARAVERRNASYGTNSVVGMRQLSSELGREREQKSSWMSSIFFWAPPDSPPPPAPVVVVRRGVNRKRSRAVAIQGVLYCCAILLTFSCDLISYMLSTAAGIWNEKFDIIAYFFTPLAGFLNLLIFIRNRNMQTPEGKLAHRVLGSLFSLLSILWCCRTDRTSVAESSSTALSGGDFRLNSTTSSGTTSKADRVVATSDWILEANDQSLTNTTEDMQNSFTGPIQEGGS